MDPVTQSHVVEGWYGWGVVADVVHSSTTPHFEGTVADVHSLAHNLVSSVSVQEPLAQDPVSAKLLVFLIEQMDLPCVIPSWSRV